jgi:hypothetical protein
MLQMVEKKLGNEHSKPNRSKREINKSQRRKENQPFPFILFLNSFGFQKFFSDSYSFLENVKMSNCSICIVQIQIIAYFNNSINK